MKIFFCFIASFFIYTWSQAQFSQPQKDSVLVFLTYPTAQYNLRLVFTPSDYSDEKENTLTEKEILSQIKNNPSDAEQYRLLCLQEKKDPQKRRDYYIQSVNLYNEWLAQDTSNVVAVEHAMDLCLKYGDWELLGRYVDFALPRYHNSIKILSIAIIYMIDYSHSLLVADALIQKALRLKPYDLEILMYKAFLEQSRFISEIQSGKTYSIDTKFTLDAVRDNPNVVAYKHLHYYNQTMAINLYAFARPPITETDSDNPFENLNLTQEDKKTLTDILAFCQNEIKKNGKNKASLLNMAGFIQCLFNNLSEAEKYYINYEQIESTQSSIEYLVLVEFLQKKWESCVKYLEKLIVFKKAQKIDVTSEYAALAKLYNRYNKNPVKEKATIDRVIAEPTENNVLKDEVLLVWYLKNKNMTELEKRMNKVNPEVTGKNTNTYLLAWAVLQNQKEEARKRLDLMKSESPTNKEISRLQKVLGL